jgi:hypothetical protein
MTNAARGGNGWQLVSPMNKSAVENLPLLASFGVLVGVPPAFILCGYEKIIQQSKAASFFP